MTLTGMKKHVGVLEQAGLVIRVEWVALSRRLSAEGDGESRGLPNDTDLAGA